MSKIYFETNQDKNELVDFLKIQSQQKDEILYGLLKEDGWQDEIKTPYKARANISASEI